jgi:hypothetical protein
MDTPIQRPPSPTEKFRQWVQKAKQLIVKDVLTEWTVEDSNWIYNNGLHDIHYHRRKLDKALWNECVSLRTILLTKRQSFEINKFKNEQTT